MATKTDTTSFVRAINEKTGVSIAVVVIIISGIAANWTMYSNVAEREARIEEQVTYIREDIRDLKAAVQGTRDGYQSELLKMHKEFAALQVRIAKLEARLNSK